MKKLATLAVLSAISATAAVPVSTSEIAIAKTPLQHRHFQRGLQEQSRLRRGWPSANDLIRRAARYGIQRLMVSAKGQLRTEGMRYAMDNGARSAHQAGEPFDAVLSFCAWHGEFPGKKTSRKYTPYQ